MTQTTFQSDQRQKVIAMIDALVEDGQVQHNDDDCVAPVNYPDDITQLFDVFSEILRLKYQPNYEDQFPVHIHLVDVTRYDYMHYAPVQRLEYKSELDDFMKAMRSAESNLAVASHEMTSMIRHMQDWHRRQAEKDDATP